MRQIYKQWKTPKGKEFTHRIRWYQLADGSDIRLQLETPEGKNNIYPKSKQEAEYEFNKFRAEYEFPADPKPTLEEWREGWEAESNEGTRQTISWDEAERRYHKQYPSDEPHEPYC